MKTQLLRWCCAICLVVLMGIGFALPAQAQVLEGETVDISQLSFNDLGAVNQSGSFVEGATSRSWIAGQTPDQFLTLSDITSLEPQQLTLEAISQITGEQLASLGLDNFPLIAQQTLNELIDAIPSIASVSLDELTPIQHWVSDLVGSRRMGRGLTLFEAIQRYPELGELELGAVDLAELAIAAIPGLTRATLSEFRGWETQLIDEIPGLNQVPLGQFPHPVDSIASQVVMRIDKIWGTAESEAIRTISGSDVEGFEVPCFRDRIDCASIELDDLETEGRVQRGPLEGVYWVSGKYQQVRGGRGLLGQVNGGMEPTGRLPFGDVFKVVVWEPSETTDTVTTALFFRVCQGMLGCTPYMIGPVPFLTLRVNAPMIVGQLDYTATPSNEPSTPTLATPGGGMPGFNELGGFELNCLDSPNLLQSSRFPQSVNLNALASAIANLESLGSGGYRAVGVHTCADGGRNCGRALGRYQFMSYNEFAVATITQRPGGRDFLRRLEQGATPTANEIEQYFPPADQERAFQSSLASNIERASTEIDPTTGQLFRGDRLIERAAQMHFGGQFSQIDGIQTDALGRLSLRDYGQRALALYQQTESSTATNVCTPLSSARSANVQRMGLVDVSFLKGRQLFLTALYLLNLIVLYRLIFQS
ncbi:MAG: M23 family peptidase [Desertifilum sp. SIO1I2]|nr:M23 family peptidase [Desertifilum sp. SIO1I2]